MKQKTCENCGIIIDEVLNDFDVWRTPYLEDIWYHKSDWTPAGPLKLCYNCASMKGYTTCPIKLIKITSQNAIAILNATKEFYPPLIPEFQERIDELRKSLKDALAGYPDW